MTSSIISPYGPGHTPTVIVVVLPSFGVGICSADALRAPPHALFAMMTAPASTAAAVRMSVWMRCFVVMMVVVSLIACSNGDVPAYVAVVMRGFGRVRPGLRVVRTMRRPAGCRFLDLVASQRPSIACCVAMSGWWIANACSARCTSCVTNSWSGHGASCPRPRRAM